MDRSAPDSAEGVIIRVRGLVQGVGFRPTVWRIAMRLGLTGEVLNDGEGVLIRAFGPAASLAGFGSALVDEAPPLSRIDTIETAPLGHFELLPEFRIVGSLSGEARTEIAPDAATCQECLSDIRDPLNRRYRYPFTNCTNCGPRLSIVRAIPYDRATTSMAAFQMCADCLSEYCNPAGRRFHAQPNACPICGPKLWLEGQAGRPAAITPHRDALAAAASMIKDGAIVAIKGIGGFHLACDASNAEAVARLRARKRRPHKPFALMARDLVMIADHVYLSDEDAALLQEPAAPIVLLERKLDGVKLASGIAPGQAALGFMLPYAPLHHLLFEEIRNPIILTSGNRSEEPQCVRNEEARERLGRIADFFLMHDRDIVNRLDDSVTCVVNARPRLIRRARGYAPSQLPLPGEFGNARVLAMGAELKSTFCFLGGGRATVSQHIGDLDDAATNSDYRSALKLYREIFRFEPQIIAVDCHPDYHSTELGKLIASDTGLPVMLIQHHHAHVAAVLAEHGVAHSAPPVIGAALDGLGLGENNELWGGEFLLADYRSYRRVGFFLPAPLIGGDKAAREPWRNLLAHLHTFLGWTRVASEYGELDIIQRLQRKPIALALQLLERGINSPPSSSAGRLFDAAAAAVGICFDNVSYEAQAAIELEALATSLTNGNGESYRGVALEGEPLRIGWAPLWRRLLDDLSAGIGPPVIAARFHAGVAATVAEATAKVATRFGCRKAVLCGGVFQNKLLMELTSRILSARNIEVLSPIAFPAGDGTIALGQAIITAARQQIPE